MKLKKYSKLTIREGMDYHAKQPDVWSDESIKLFIKKHISGDYSSISIKDYQLNITGFKNKALGCDNLYIKKYDNVYIALFIGSDGERIQLIFE